MFLLLLSVVQSQHPPFLIIPGAMGSRLSINTTRQPHWFCPASLENVHIYLRVRDLFPPFLSCMLDYWTLDYDEETQTLASHPNSTLWAEDFGGVDGIRGIGPEVFGHYLPVYYEKYIKSFELVGYKIRKDIFSAPYDWRFGAEQPQSYYDALKGLIEHAYELNGKTKVALMSHNLGGIIMEVFLSEKTTPEWRAKYIHSGTYVAPSWSGSGQSFFALYRQRFPFVHFTFDSLKEFVSSLGSFHAQIPNAIAYSNTTLVIGPDGKNYTGADIPKIIREHGKLTPKQLKMAEINFKYQNRLPKTPDYDVNILYNSGVRTPLGLKFKDWDDVGAPIYGRGDAMVGARVIDWACEHWKTNGKSLRCRDVRSDDRLYHHRYLIKTPEMIQQVRDWIVGKDPSVLDAEMAGELPVDL